MTLSQGLNTKYFGSWLIAAVEAPSGGRILVYYDHGDNRDRHVVVPKAFFGNTVSSKNRLADIDVMIANSSGDIEVLIEIEERPIEPKKLLGVVLAILMANKVAIKKDQVQRYFEITNRTRLIIGGLVPDRGSRLDKIQDIIQPRIHQMAGFNGSINPKKIELIFTNNIESTIERLKARIADLYAKDMDISQEQYDQ